MSRFQPLKLALRKPLWLLVILVLISTACGDVSTPTEATPLPQGMPFDEASRIYELTPGSTEARFLIGEILRGEPKTVVGKTSQVSGQIALNLDDPSLAAVGPIQVDARTLLTDNSFRNRAIETRILLSRVFQFITFTPTTITGLPGTLTTGQPVDFQIMGDLTITEYTKPVVFDVTAVPLSDTRIEGSAATTIQRSDFNLFVPSATGVAGVEEAVILEINFTAEAAQ